MSNSVFRSLMIHTCAIQKFVPTVAGSSTYGHQSNLTTPPATVAQAIPCRLRQFSAQELYAMGQGSGTIIGSHMLYIPWEFLPDELNHRTGPTRFQIVNVSRVKGGLLIDAGPFDIEEVGDAAGEAHHAQLRLKRVS